MGAGSGPRVCTSAAWRKGSPGTVTRASRVIPIADIAVCHLPTIGRGPRWLHKGLLCELPKVARQLSRSERPVHAVLRTCADCAADTGPAWLLGQSARCVARPAVTAEACCHARGRSMYCHRDTVIKLDYCRRFSTRDRAASRVARLGSSRRDCDPRRVIASLERPFTHRRLPKVRGETGRSSCPGRS